MAFAATMISSIGFAMESNELVPAAQAAIPAAQAAIPAAQAPSLLERFMDYFKLHPTSGSIEALVAQGVIKPEEVIKTDANRKVTIDLRSKGIETLDEDGFDMLLDSVKPPIAKDNIRAIQLNGNKFTTLSPSFLKFLGQLPNLEEIWLGQNKLEELPEFFLDKNPKIKVVGLADNPELKGVPTNLFANKTDLTLINFKNTELTPAQLRNLPENVKRALNPEAKAVIGTGSISEPVKSTEK